jgi:hypothetical protein
MAAFGLLVACGDKPQTASTAAKKTDTPAWQGADDGFVARGWKAGDKASWEAQLRTRSRGQNEYTRIAGSVANK